ncbi:hypothetical protein DOT_5049 [Desulfosporosinus sp. OT]|nr:hypothetical protein DOT_5049 [Desulfosporosinus sp. OT]
MGIARRFFLPLTPFPVLDQTLRFFQQAADFNGADQTDYLYFEPLLDECNDTLL